MAEKNIKKPKINEPDTNIPGRLGTEPTTPNLSQIGIPPVEATRVVPNTPNSVPDATVPSHSEAESTAPNVSQMGIPPVEATRVVPSTSNSLPDTNTPNRLDAESTTPLVSQMGLPPVEATRVVPSTPNSIPDANIPGHSVAEPTTPNVSQMDMPPVEASRVIPPKAQNSVPDANIPGHSAAEPTIPNVSQMGVPAPTTPVADSTPTNTTPVAAPNSSAAIQQSQIDAMNKNIDPLTGKPVTTVDKNPDEFKYRFNWGQPGVDLDSMLKTLVQSKDPTSKRQIIDDYLRYMHDNNLPVDYYTLNDIVMKSHDLSLSPADDEAEKKFQERKERWDKVNNFLMHLGNAIGNVASGNYGSVKLEDPVHWSERQRQLKEKALEQRRLNNQSIIQQMHKNWADERANRVQQQNYEMKQRELNLKEDTQKHKEYMDSYKIKIAQQKFDYQKEKDKLDRELKAKQISQKDYALRIAALNASVNEYRAYNPVTTTTTKTDSRGRKSTTESVQSRGGNAGSGNKGNGYGGGTQKGKGY